MKQHIKLLSRLVEKATDIERKSPLDYTFKANIGVDDITINIRLSSDTSLVVLRHKFTMTINNFSVNQFVVTADIIDALSACFQKLYDKHFDETNQRMDNAYKLYDKAAEYFNIKL